MTAHFEERQADIERFAAFVVYDAPDRLAAYAVRGQDRHLPGFAGGDGDVGHIADVSTVPEWRRRGCARATMSTLGEWTRTREMRGGDLNATARARCSYRSLGFETRRMLPPSAPPR